jgi:hypothetical protein
MIASVESKKGCPKAIDAGLRLTATQRTRLSGQDETLLSMERLLTTMQRLSIGVTASVAQDESVFNL